MRQGETLAIFAGLLGMLGWGLADLFAKKTIDAIGDIKTLVIAHLFGTGGVVAIALAEFGINHREIFIPRDGMTWLGFAFFGALQALVYLLVYIGFGKGQVAVLNPIFSCFSGLVALVSLVFLGEQLKGKVVLALFVTFIGVMLMSVDLKALRAHRTPFVHVPGLFQIAFATLFATTWTIGWSRFVSGVDWLSCALWMYLAMTITLLAYAFIRRISLRVHMPTAWPYLVFIGLFEMGAYVAISWGYGATKATSVVAVLSGAFSLPTIIEARLWLRERTTREQLIGSIVIIIGIALVSLFS
jgi:drug/metabolite transporter (DMT)-like permease